MRSPDGGLAVGRALPGRGAWLCAATAATCAQLAAKRRAWSQALRSEVPARAVDVLVARLGTPSGGGEASARER